MKSRLAVGIVLAVGLVASVLSTTALGSPSTKKAIWGPVRVDGTSQFPIYNDLGAGIYQATLAWNGVAPTRPTRAADPDDPAYRWPADIDDALRQARRYGMRVSLLVTGTPAWANGGRDPRWAPTRARDFARFVAAASRRFPRVRSWMIWGEPSKAGRFQPVVRSLGRRMTARQKRGPRRYARMLDAAYRALKRVNSGDLVIGGNTWTGGEITPLNFIRAMRLPNGRRPRMDLYGHNPFTARGPRLDEFPLRYGFADFSDLDTLASWLDRYGYHKPRGGRLRLFLSEFVIPTDQRNHEFNFWVDRRTQAGWLRAAFRITRRWRRIYTLGYLGLYDDPPRPDGLEVNRGLIDRQGRRKPAYFAYRDG